MPHSLLLFLVHVYKAQCITPLFVLPRSDYHINTIMYQLLTIQWTADLYYTP